MDIENKHTSVYDDIVAKYKTREDKFQLGSHILELIHKHQSTYLSVTFPVEEGQISTYFYLSELYKDSIDALANILQRGCTCDNHPGKLDCSVNTVRQYTFLEVCAIGYGRDFIMARKDRIEEIAKNVTCPFLLLTDENIREDITEYVDTGESLGWYTPPDRRQYFVEDGHFDDSMFYELLFDIETVDLIPWLDQWLASSNITKRHHIMNQLRYMLVTDIGTMDCLVELVIQNQHYIIPYHENRDSLEHICQLLNDPPLPNTIPKTLENYRKFHSCFAHQKLACQHDGHLYSGYILPYMLIYRDPFILVDRKLISPDKITELISTLSCPFSLLNDIENILQ